MELKDADFATGGLRLVSYARPGKLFTAHESLFVRSVGVLQPETMKRLIAAVVAMFQSGSS